MKNRLTNNHFYFIKHIQGELSKPFSTESIITFSVFPSLTSGHFSIQVIKGNHNFMIVRQWNQDLGESYQHGIYNLDNVRISEERVNISDNDLDAILELACMDMKVKEFKGIILDGADFKLTITYQKKTKAYEWRTEAQISIETKRLIKKLIDMTGLQHKLFLNEDV